ncbi:MAG TPA: ABC transporter ATP-binding protein [Planctomycetota bacterium]|nr:ABC transporter ATP-binding protein [Planctomycetota bacterium]
MSLLEIRNLRTTFRSDEGTVKAVDGLDLAVGEGEVLGVVGESGSGKSVTMLSLMGLVEQPGLVEAEGLRFEGKDLLKASAEEMRRLRGNRMAMIFQDPMTSLNPFLTVEEQVCEVLQVHKGMRRAAARDRSVALLEEVGIPGAARRLRDYPHQFSGGMRQRVMIAIALACEPALLIADEPTTALDVTIQAQILDLLRKLRAERKMSVILITHDLGVVAGMCERVKVMYAGKIVEEGPTRNLFKDPRHPYTRALLASLPRLDEPEGAQLRTIPGLPPNLSRVPPGCPFHPRCAHAEERCSRDVPRLETVGLGHRKACWVEVKR